MSQCNSYKDRGPLQIEYYPWQYILLKPFTYYHHIQFPVIN
ncbi:hypothetical protein BVRB_1g003130 [Beta vulgaris subsp. vulgaris]|nr:hypothetical protein BVRB_1g003130 [Beta vulgaris subsp. vulgaris]